jgi:hypothetical protein
LATTDTEVAAVTPAITKLKVAFDVVVLVTRIFVTIVVVVVLG